MIRLRTHSFVAVLLTVLLVPISIAWAQATFPDRLGVGLEGIGGRGLEFVDVGKTLRLWEAINGGLVASDEEGWPLADARTVFFDLRPTGAWGGEDYPNGPDDPDRYQIELGGLYKLSFTGRATLINAGGDSFEVVGQHYDTATNVTTAGIRFPPGKGILFMGFSGTSGGVKKVRLIRPGYPADTTQTFSTPFLKAIMPFRILRFMDFTQTNDNNPAFPNVMEWADRKTTSHATQVDDGTTRGAAWEYVAEMAKIAHKDIWINIPVAATDEYVHELAVLMFNTLPPDVNIYIEHSNEVWNGLFSQNKYNSDSAIAEVAKGGSNLNNDGFSDYTTVSYRRHARRTLVAGQIFREVFGAPSAGRIRPILAWWVLQPNQYRFMLNWLKKTYGPPNQFLYGIATTGYFNAGQASPSATPQQILAAMRANADAAVRNWYEFNLIAQDFNLKHCVYEGGSDTGGGSATNVANRIRAERDSAMKDLVIHHLRENWFAKGGDLFMYFTLSSAYSRYGCWGATDDITKFDTPKYSALLELVGAPVPDLPVRMFFPFYRGGSDIFTGFAVSNYGEQTALLELNAFGPDGARLAFPDVPSYQSLPPHSQLAKLGHELFNANPGSPQAGWVEMKGSQPVAGFFQFGGADRLDGSVALDSVVRKFFFTRVFNGPTGFRGQPARTFLSIANPSSAGVVLKLALVRPGSQPLAPDVTLSIPATGFIYRSVSELFGEAAQTDNAYLAAEVTEGDGAVGFELIELEDQTTVIGLNASPASDATTLYSAQLATIPGLFTSVKLINTGNQPRTVQLEAVNDSGGVLSPAVEVHLNAGEMYEKDAEEICNLTAGATAIGTLRVRADGPGLIGDVVFGDSTAFSYAAALPLQSRTFTHAVFSQVASVGDFFTGLALYNAGGQVASVHLQVFSYEGGFTGEAQLPLAPGARLSQVLTQLVPSTLGQVRGYIVIDSTQPLIAQQLFGNLGSGRLLSAVPPSMLE